MFSVAIISPLLGVRMTAAATGPIPIIGANGVDDPSSSFVNYVASQGLLWNRQCLCFLSHNGTPTQGYENTVAAGVKTIALIPDSPETNCGSGTLANEASYKSIIQQWVNEFPAIHFWEYGNEVNSPCASNGGSGWNIGPVNYFIGLVWAYQQITSNPGHSTDLIIGPTNTIWTGTNAGVNRNCYNTETLAWFQSFWSQSYEGYTPSSILTYVSLHVYTQQYLWSQIPNPAGTGSICDGETVSQMLTQALDAYYNTEAQSKLIIITETGFQYNTGGGLTAQTEWYQGMMPFYQSLGFIEGVFAYEICCNFGGWGIFQSDSLGGANPAWSVYQSYLSTQTTTTTNIITSSSCAGIGYECRVPYPQNFSLISLGAALGRLGLLDIEIITTVVLSVAVAYVAYLRRDS